VDVGGQSTPSGQQIWTLRNVPGHSGNTPKVPVPIRQIFGQDLTCLAFGASAIAWTIAEHNGSVAVDGKLINLAAFATPTPTP